MTHGDTGLALDEASAQKALAGITAMIDNIEHWMATGEPASPERSKALYEGLIAARQVLNGNSE